MPIPRHQLEAAKQPLSERILAFLSSDKDAAYSLVEIYAGVEGYKPDGMMITAALLDPASRRKMFERYEEALGALEASGRIVRAIYQGQPHFAAT